ncbi:armi, partial [Drosophila busckii]
MISLFRTFFQHSKRDQQLNHDLFDLENKFLDIEFNEQQCENIEQCEDINQAKSEDALHISEISGKSCFNKKGVITHLIDDGGVIDNALPFDKQAAIDIFRDLHIGCVVELLVYQNKKDVIKVVKIQKILEQNWENVSSAKLQKAVESLKHEKPTYFNMQLRNILGVITERQPNTIRVDTDYGELSIELDDIELNFIPRTGDCICLECNVQMDESYVDKQGEILQVLKVFPARLESNQKCVVERVFESIVVLSKLAYIAAEDIPNGIELHLGDIVRADLIESKSSKYTHRAINLTVLEKNFGQMKNNASSASSNKLAVSIHGEDRFIFTEQWKKYAVSLILKNNCNRTMQLREIEIDHSADSQLSVVEPLGSQFIEAGSQISLIFEIHTKFIGESKETFTLIFEKFKVKRHLTVIVCETEEEAKEADRRLIAAKQLMSYGRTVDQRSRSYANQVWSHKSAMVPGEGIHTKRRFIAVRIGSYDVPEKLRQMVLTTERRTELFELLHSEYPFLKDNLSIQNYAQRFSLLLNLEEIEQFINFRNYDRERAHFQRDGEFLSLQIENLSERRPSLVLGDTVRAYNPWADVNTKENKSFEGVIHKVLLNRVLLKFNSNFQDKYNSEDYRLEFYFSRFSFRKQHYAIGRAQTHLGEKFLFPNKVTKKQHPQLEVTFKDDHMFLHDSKLEWFNKSLNSIQKRAVYNILLGEAENIPYVIFGPPGTGKTVTVVEALLQLVRNLPGSRLLVGTPSNSSADLITKRIIDSKALHQGDFIRLVSQNQIEKDLIPPELMSYCATMDIGSVDDSHDSMITTESGLKMRCQKKFLGQHRVFISTCTTLGNLIQMGFPPGHITHVLIDEAGQCTESETIIPIILLPQLRHQVILAGDPYQLQPIIINKHAAKLGFGVSLLERLLDRAPYRKDMQRFPTTAGHNPSVLTKLLNNYRALPSIMSVYSKLFYDNELIPMVCDQESREAKLLMKLQTVFEPHTGMPHSHGTFFYGILGENIQESDSPSWHNPSEAGKIFMFTIELYRGNVHPDQIGILTPYAKQVKTLRNMFIGADITMPKIGSVEEFQGQERDIMLISTVRSSESFLNSDSRLSLGFVGCNKRMNVAISRARCLMVVFGNPKLLSIDDSWRHLILFCANNNAYFGCELPNLITNENE